MAKRKKECECPKCHELKPMTRHHILPKRIYGRNQNKHIFLLCRRCHNALELRIPLGRIPRRFYFSILLTFLLEDRQPPLNMVHLYYMKVINVRTKKRTKLHIFQCKVCLVTFGSYRNTSTHCSRTCGAITASKKKRTGVYRECSVCSILFYCHPSADKKARGARKFCSRGCQFKNKKLGLPIGEYFSYDGYIVVSKTKDGRRQIKKHRLIMEKEIGRRLLSKEIVHHIDGDKLNNSITNLHIMSVREHNQHHADERKKTVTHRQEETQ